MSREKLLPHFLSLFAKRICKLYNSHHLSDQWLTDGRYNQEGWLHARLWGAMTKAVPDEYVANLEVLVHTPGRKEKSFKPDLTICNSKDEREMIVELESTNSSDDRVIYRDIDRLKYVANLEKASRPRMALIITVLPSVPVTYLPMYDGLSKDKRAERRGNPYAFHHRNYLCALEQLRSNIPFSVAWANLDVDGLYLKFWDGPYKRRRFWPTRA